jgi:hypothetical protein
LQAIQYSLFVGSRDLGTSRRGLTLQSSQCKLLPCLAEARESGFQHQLSATLVPELCEVSQCSGLNLLLLHCCLIFKEIGPDHPKRCYTTQNNNLLRM